MKPHSRIRISSLVTILFLVAAVMLPSCRKTPINGDLDGQWRLDAISYPDGQVEHPADVFLRIALHVAQYADGPTGKMTYDYPSLIIDFPYEQGVERFYQYGITANFATDPSQGVVAKFNILSLSKKHLVMTTPSSTQETEVNTLTFSKF